VGFSKPSVDLVLSYYTRRIADEEVKAAAMGSQMLAHRDEFLLPVGVEAGWFLHSLILAKRPARVLELGTSYGFSTLFLADAVTQTGGKLITMELAGHKQAEARSNIEKAGLSGAVDFRLGDAVSLIQADPGPFDFVLLDIWKELYVPCLQALYPKLADEAIVAADNIIEPSTWRHDARKYRDAVNALPDMKSALLPIGSGIELSVRWTAQNPKL
jgi:predicted O-methyltransferase YrrM